MGLEMMLQKSKIDINKCYYQKLLIVLVDIV